MNLPHSTQLHFWYTRLDVELYDNKSILLLTADEKKRAQRFKFALHRKRFITTRAALRSILSLYLNNSPQNVLISYSPQGKPFLENAILQFNLSHSHDLVVYVFAKQMELGIDLEKIQPRYNDMVAKRLFSTEEYARLLTLPKDQQVTDFYRIWTGKEALVKAQGEKLNSTLSTVTLPGNPGPNKLIIKNAFPKIWYLENLDLFPGYHTTVVTNAVSTHHCFWEWGTQGVKKWRDDLQRDLA